jgi:hypothetical protein
MLVTAADLVAVLTYGRERGTVQYLDGHRLRSCHKVVGNESLRCPHLRRLLCDGIV